MWTGGWSNEWLGTLILKGYHSQAYAVTWADLGKTHCQTFPRDSLQLKHSRNLVYCKHIHTQEEEEVKNINPPPPGKCQDLKAFNLKTYLS